jgi:hypothetical protein
MKSFKNILFDMVSWMKLTNTKVTNYTVGSVVRSILEATALEIEELYYFIRSKFDQLKEDSIYNSFGFQKLPATPAEGYVTVRFSQPLTQSVAFPAGERFFTATTQGQESIYFTTTEGRTATIGMTEISLLVRCETPGVIGNVPPYTIRHAVRTSPYVVEIFNDVRFYTGAPEETKEARHNRFQKFVRSIRRATPESVEYGCSQVPGVAGVFIKEDIGMIYVYVHDFNGDLPDTLRSAVETQIYNYKAGGIKAIVAGVTKREVDLNIEVLIADGYDQTSILAKVEDSVEVYLNKHTVSKNLVRADLIHHIMDIDREAIRNVNVNMTSDIVVQDQELIRPGMLRISRMV